MLDFIKISNLAIIKDSQIEFGDGLNVITGETGAGKSIILKAVSLLIGDKASKTLVRQGCDKLEVQGVFSVSKEVLDKVSHALGGKEVEELIISRTVDRSGKSRAFICGNLVPISTLKEITSSFVELTSQHQYVSLLMPSGHVRVLDSFSKSEELLQGVKSAYLKYSQNLKALNKFKEDSARAKEEYEFICSRVEELEALNLVKGEEDELREKELELKKLYDENEELIKISSLIEDSSIVDAANSLRAEISKLDIDAPFISAIDSGVVALVDGISDLQIYGSRIDIDERELDKVSSRLYELGKIKRKYSKDIDQLVDYLEELKGLKTQVEGSSFDEKKLQQAVSESEQELEALCKDLSAHRKKHAATLEKKVDKELSSLEMKGARFVVSIQPAEYSVDGSDKVEFLLSSNKGVEPKPLAQAASGGELSRVLLVLKTLTGEQGLSLQIFDEIDSGLGGEAAGVVGRKLKSLSRSSQIVAVTHSPQVASFGDRHLKVAKKEVKNETISNAAFIDGKKREEELARMIGGADISKAMLETAKELIVSGKL